jgi:hypothetical protein
VVIRPIRPRLASILVVLAVLLGVLGSGAATAHQGAGQGSNPAVAAALVHAGQFVSRNQDPGPRNLAERGHRQGPVPTSALLAMLVGALALAGLGSRIGVRRSAARAGQCGGPRRTWSRAPPCHLQPV